MRPRQPAATCLLCACRAGVRLVPAGCWKARSISRRLSASIPKMRLPASCSCAVPIRVRTCGSSPTKRKNFEPCVDLMAYLPREVNAAMRPAGLLWGRLLASNPAWPLHFSALLGDLRPRFLDKGRVGRSHRAIARNGRVLLVSELPLEALANNVVRIRLQVWHRALLSGDAPEPYGWLLCVRSPLSRTDCQSVL